MQKINNLSGLLKDHLKKLLSSEQQLLGAIPQIVQHAHSIVLKKNIAACMAVKEVNYKRLKQCFNDLELNQQGPKCEIMQRLIESCKSVINHTAEAHVSDAGLISTLQQINHFSIANYGTASSFSKTLGKEHTSSVLHRALVDEKNIDRQLSQVAEEIINPAAVLA